MKRNFAFWLHYLMRLKPTNSAFLLTLCCTLVLAFSVNAQEDKSQAEIEAAAKEALRNEPDPILTSESDSRLVKPLPIPASTKEIQRDSIQVKTVKPIKSPEKTQEEEDPLSFNFLYYIIGKFKLSDIIE